MTGTGENREVFLTEFCLLPLAGSLRGDVVVELQVADRSIKPSTAASSSGPLELLFVLAALTPVTHICRRLGARLMESAWQRACRASVARGENRGKAAGTVKCNYAQDHRRTGLSPRRIIRSGNGRGNACFS